MTSRPQRRATAVGMVGADADLEAVVDHVLRQGADLGRQRGSRAGSSATSTSAGPRSAATRHGQALPDAADRGAVDATAAPPGPRSRSVRRPTTASTPSPTAARCGPTARATSTSSASRAAAAAEFADRCTSRPTAAPTSAGPAVVAPAVSPGVFDRGPRPPRDGRHRRRPRRPRCRAERRHRQRCPHRGRRHRPDRPDAGPTAPTGSTTSTCCSPTSRDGGATWASPRAIESAGDRPVYTAPAISPNGTDVYVVYNAFTTPFRDNTTASARPDRGVPARRRHWLAFRARSPRCSGARPVTRAAPARTG